MPHLSLNLPKVIGHRGACFYAPENTLASLRKAAELGVSWVEFDVMLTADHQPIIMHDETLSRTTNGHGEVAKTTYQEIQTLDAGSWFSSEFVGEKIPTLSEYLRCVVELGLGINLEIKPTPGKEIETAKCAIETLLQYFPMDSKNMLVSSFSVQSLEAVRAIHTGLPLGLLLEEWCSDWQLVLKRLDCVSLNVSHKMLSPESVVEAKKHAQYVLAYTVDDAEEAKRFFSWGVDTVFSNRPDVL